MHASVRVRVFLAHHRWVYWLLVGALALSVGLVVHSELRRVAAARASWGDTSEVVVADGDQGAGQAPRVVRRRMPNAMLPSAALGDIPSGATLRQRVSDGEVITGSDITAAVGPVGGATVEMVVVGVLDPLARGAVVGARVRVASEGVVLAEAGEVVSLNDEIVFVAVEPRDAPMIAAAAQAGVASIIFLP